MPVPPVPIADSADRYAALTLFTAGAKMLPVESKIDMLAPAANDRLEGMGAW